MPDPDSATAEIDGLPPLLMLLRRSVRAGFEQVARRRSYRREIAV